MDPKRRILMSMHRAMKELAKVGFPTLMVMMVLAALILAGYTLHVMSSLLIEVLAHLRSA